MDRVTDPTELGKRLRAARGYAGLSRPELAQRMGISESTVRRREDGDIGALGGKPAKRQATVDAVLEATGAPSLIVMEIGDGVVIPTWSKAAGDSSTEQRLADVEEQLAQLRRQLEEELSVGLEADEETEARRSESTGGNSSTSEPGAANG